MDLKLFSRRRKGKSPCLEIRNWKRQMNVSWTPCELWTLFSWLCVCAWTSGGWGPTRPSSAISSRGVTMNCSSVSSFSVSGCAFHPFLFSHTVYKTSCYASIASSSVHPCVPFSFPSKNWLLRKRRWMLSVARRSCSWASVSRRNSTDGTISASRWTWQLAKSRFCTTMWWVFFDSFRVLSHNQRRVYVDSFNLLDFLFLGTCRFKGFGKYHLASSFTLNLLILYIYDIHPCVLLIIGFSFIACIIVNVMIINNGALGMSVTAASALVIITSTIITSIIIFYRLYS